MLGSGRSSVLPNRPCACMTTKKGGRGACRCSKTEPAPALSAKQCMGARAATYSVWGACGAGQRMWSIAGCIAWGQCMEAHAATGLVWCACVAWGPCMRYDHTEKRTGVGSLWEERGLMRRLLLVYTWAYFFPPPYDIKFRMFHAFQMYIACVSSRSCMCFIWIFYMLQWLYTYVTCVFQIFHLFHTYVVKCFIWMLHMFRWLSQTKCIWKHDQAKQTRTLQRHIHEYMITNLYLYLYLIIKRQILGSFFSSIHFFVRLPLTTEQWRVSFVWTYIYNPCPYELE
jgi:hypothetical protein